MPQQPRRNKLQRRHNPRGDRLREIKAQQRASRTPPSVAATAVLDAETADQQEGVGIVAEIHRSSVRVLDGDRLVDALPTRKSTTSGSLAIGDRVRYVQGDSRSVIVEVEPRHSRLARMRGDRTRRSGHGTEEAVLAANIDVAVIVVSAASPPFHPGLIDRYLVICQHGSITPVICVNKCDLVTNPPDLRDYRRFGIPVILTSTEPGKEQGLARLRAVLKGKVSVFTGHSGVGKSSLVNALVGQELLATSAVSEKGAMGRHTTSASRLIRVGRDALVIDTPGIRSLGLWKIQPAELRSYFPEFRQLALGCMYRNCTHILEPNCAVREAAGLGQIPRLRYDSYVRMMNARGMG